MGINRTETTSRSGRMRSKGIVIGKWKSMNAQTFDSILISSFFSGKDRNLNILELLCVTCNRWFHESCIGFQLGKLIPFSTNYVFVCKNCSPTGLESFRKSQACMSLQIRCQILISVFRLFVNSNLADVHNCHSQFTTNGCKRREMQANVQ